MNGVATELQDTRELSVRALGASDAKGAMTVREIIGREALQHAVTQDHLESRWEELLKGDQTASFYQTPLWCLTWYHCYHDEYEPVVLTVWIGNQLRGVVPCAQARTNQQLIFAGAGMADYRDVVSAWADRAAVLDVIIPRMQAYAGGHPIAFGQTQPDSPTTALVETWAQRHAGQRTVRVTHPCYRFTYGGHSSQQIEEMYKKKTIRQAFAYYQRRDGLHLQIVDTTADWARLREEYFTQHGLRQAGSDRAEAFEDPRKQRLYDQLFISGSPTIHFSCLWTGGKPLAFAFCFIFRKVLYYGAPSFDILETKHSPGMLHIIELVKSCHREQYAEVDLTIGSAAFKGRIGNRCVQLPTVYLYEGKRRYWRARARGVVVDRFKWALRAIAPERDIWGKLKEYADHITWYRARYRQSTWRRILRFGVERATKLVHWNYCADVYAVSPDRFQCMRGPDLGDSLVLFHTNRLADFLALDGPEHRDRAFYVQDAVRQLGQGRTLHTVMVDGKLAQFGWSFRPVGVVAMPETESEIMVPEQTVSLYQFYTCEAFRGRKLYQANLAKIVNQEFANGAMMAVIVCERRNVTSRSGILKLGFVLRETHRLIRWGWWERKGID
ncbi:MAG: GNAT family N-acetyltransferase [Nitrospira sp.]|nr:GNAT family N-acetyltransferase [Nitrospira sp.]